MLKKPATAIAAVALVAAIGAPVAGAETATAQTMSGAGYECALVGPGQLVECHVTGDEQGLVDLNEMVASLAEPYGITGQTPVVVTAWGGEGGSDRQDGDFTGRYGGAGGMASTISTVDHINAQTGATDGRYTLYLGKAGQHSTVYGGGFSTSAGGSSTVLVKEMSEGTTPDLGAVVTIAGGGSGTGGRVENVGKPGGVAIGGAVGSTCSANDAYTCGNGEGPGGDAVNAGAEDIGGFGGASGYHARHGEGRKGAPTGFANNPEVELSSDAGRGGNGGWSDPFTCGWGDYVGWRYGGGGGGGFPGGDGGRAGLSCPSWPWDSPSTWADAGGGGGSAAFATMSSPAAPTGYVDSPAGRDGALTITFAG